MRFRRISSSDACVARIVSLTWPKNAPVGAQANIGVDPRSTLTGRRRLQAGFLTWAVLAILLVLVPIVWVGVIDGFRESLPNQKFESRVVPLLKYINVTNSSKKMFPIFSSRLNST